MATNINGLNSAGEVCENENSCFGREWTMPVSIAAVIANR